MFLTIICLSYKSFNNKLFKRSSSGFLISIKLNDVKKIRKIIKSNKKIFSFYTKFISNTKKNKKTKIALMYMIGNVNAERIEPPLIDFLIKKITPKYVLDIRTSRISAKKHWRSFDIIKYKGLNLNVPNYPKKYS